MRLDSTNKLKLLLRPHLVSAPRTTPSANSIATRVVPVETSWGIQLGVSGHIQSFILATESVIISFFIFVVKKVSRQNLFCYLCCCFTQLCYCITHATLRRKFLRHAAQFNGVQYIFCVCMNGSLIEFAGQTSSGNCGWMATG